ncbi:MAG: hypothetical protein MUO77_03085 [Anaerolineales bacterium]|nr:hypothetical protein [Anaerolineales bacterium]
MIKFGLPELICVIVLMFVILLIVGPNRIGRFLGEVAKFFRVFFEQVNTGEQGKEKNWTSVILVIIGLIGGYNLGSKILPMLVYTSWERHVVGTNTENYTSGLRGDYSVTALLGGIVGAILLSALALFVSRLLKKQ